MFDKIFCISCRPNKLIALWIWKSIQYNLKRMILDWEVKYLIFSPVAPLIIMWYWTIHLTFLSVIFSSCKMVIIVTSYAAQMVVVKIKWDNKEVLSNIKLI